MAWKRADDPTNRKTQIKRWLADNPGHHTPAVIAAALDLTTQHAAQDCIRLWREGRAVRGHIQVKGRKQPLTTYALLESGVDAKVAP